MKKIILLSATVGVLAFASVTVMAQSQNGFSGGAGNRTSPSTGSGIDETPPKKEATIRDPNTGEALNPAHSSIIDASKSPLNGTAAGEFSDMTSSDCDSLSSRSTELSSQEYGARQRYCIEQNLGSLSRTPGDTSTMRSDTRFGTQDTSANDDDTRLPGDSNRRVNRSITGKPVEAAPPTSITGR